MCSFILGFAVSAPLTGMRTVYEQQEDTGTLFTLRENTSITRKCFMERIHLDHGSRVTTLPNYNSSFTE